jgi:hypothetical protein
MIPDESRKVWIAGAPDRTCDICLDLDERYGSGAKAEGIPIDEEFKFEIGGVSYSVPGPPAHPSCRCDMGLVTPTELIDKEQTMPEGTGLTGDAAAQWQTVYDECVKAGDDEATAAKKAWGAVHNSGLAKSAGRWTAPVRLVQRNDDQHIVFGWLSVAKDERGILLMDTQEHEIEPDVLEPAVYEFVLNFRKMGDVHERTEGMGRLIESVMLTKEKQAAMGIPDGCVPEGWWVGFKVDAEDVWQKIKNGDYEMLSLGGDGLLEEIEPVPAAPDSVDTTVGNADVRIVYDDQLGDKPYSFVIVAVDGTEDTDDQQYASEDEAIAAAEEFVNAQAALPQEE